MKVVSKRKKITGIEGVPCGLLKFQGFRDRPRWIGPRFQHLTDPQIIMQYQIHHCSKTKMYMLTLFGNKPRTPEFGFKEFHTERRRVPSVEGMWGLVDIALEITNEQKNK